MIDDENNRWQDDDSRQFGDDTEGDVMEKMFNSKKKRNILRNAEDLNQNLDTKEQSNLSKNQNDKNQDTKNLGSGQSDIKEYPDLPSDYPYPKTTEDSGQKLGNDAQDLPRNSKRTISAKTDRSAAHNDKEKTKDITKLRNGQIPEQSISKSDIQEVIKLLRDIVTIERETYGFKKYPYDEKSRQAMEEGTAVVYKYRNYYDVINTIKRAGPEDPQDFDSQVYNAERIFEILERYSDIIYVINDGVEPLFCVISHEGRTNFSKESVILPGEVKQYYNTYELRLRSPTVGHPYRVTEYMIVDVSETSFIPFELASLQDVDLPSAGENWLEEDIIPIHPPTTIRTQVAVSKTGIFSAAITNGGNTQAVNFNVTSGPELIEDGVYVFELLANKGDTVNFRYSVDDGKIKILRVQEIDASTA